MRLSKKRLYLKHKKNYRRIRRRNRIKKLRNIRSNIGSNIYRPNNVKNKGRSYFDNGLRKLVAPELFSFFKNSDFVIDYINQIDKLEKKRSTRQIRFELDNIKDIDLGAISLLLSKINELSYYKINCYGSLPKDNVCKEFIYDSGFLDQMINVQTRKKFERNGKNLIVNRGFDKTDNKKTADEIKKTMLHLTGEPSRFPPLYSIIQEICSNSVEHANVEKYKKNWLIASNYDNPEKVTYTLTDMGEGIIKTIKKKKLDGILRLMQIKKSTDMLSAIFNKEYSSSTLDINRNKGLPKILEVHKKGYIENLVVVTNNALYDFDNPRNARVLNRNFKGTFYYWEINLNCIEKWKK